MIHANLIRKNGGYTNEDAIDKTLRYIFRLRNLHEFYYGVWPQTVEAAVKQFQQTRTILKKQNIEKQVQHFYITFYDYQNIELILAFSSDVAQIFARQYQVCFALHNDGNHLHTHFIVSTTSYQKDCPPLSDSYFNHYYSEIQKSASQYDIFVKEFIEKHV